MWMGSLSVKAISRLRFRYRSALRADFNAGQTPARRSPMRISDPSPSAGRGFAYKSSAAHKRRRLPIKQVAGLPPY